MQKQVMTTQEVAEYVGVEPKEIRRLNREGILKSLRGFRCPKKYSFHVVRCWLDGEDQKRK